MRCVSPIIHRTRDDRFPVCNSFLCTIIYIYENCYPVRITDQTSMVVGRACRGEAGGERGRHMRRHPRDRRILLCRMGRKRTESDACNLGKVHLFPLSIFSGFSLIDSLNGHRKTTTKTALLQLTQFEPNEPCLVNHRNESI